MQDVVPIDCKYWWHSLNVGVLLLSTYVASYFSPMMLFISHDAHASVSGFIGPSQECEFEELEDLYLYSDWGTDPVLVGLKKKKTPVL
jgi:hypothetical protein